jgi:hypothetical protein
MSLSLSLCHCVSRVVYPNPAGSETFWLSRNQIRICKNRSRSEQRPEPTFFTYLYIYLFQIRNDLQSRLRIRIRNTESGSRINQSGCAALTMGQALASYVFRRIRGRLNLSRSLIYKRHGRLKIWRKRARSRRRYVSTQSFVGRYM